MIGRRSFIRVLGVIPAAAAAPAEALKMVGIRSAGLGSISHAVGIITGPDDPSGTSTNDPNKAANWLLANGLPSFVKEALRRDRRVPNGLDPNLVANRSFSLAAKVAIQRERDFERACADTMAQQRTDMARRALGKVLGQELYW